MAITITLTLVLGFARYVKFHKHEALTIVLNEDCSTANQDTERDTGDYPSMPDDQAMESINIKQNEAYATNAEAKLQCVACAAKITTERNYAYGTRFHDDVVLHREIDTYDYPTMDD